MSDKKDFVQMERPGSVPAIRAADLVYVDREKYEELKAKVERQDDLLRRAMTIISDAIMHGMPITKEVSDVRNEILAP